MLDETGNCPGRRTLRRAARVGQQEKTVDHSLVPIPHSTAPPQDIERCETLRSGEDYLNHPIIALAPADPIRASVQRGDGLTDFAGACEDVERIALRDLQPGDVVILEMGVRLVVVVKARSKRWTEAYCYLDGNTEEFTTVLISARQECRVGSQMELFTHHGRVYTRPISRLLADSPHRFRTAPTHEG